MKKQKTNKLNTKYTVKVKSKVHPEIYHSIQLDLHCYEKMPKEKSEKNKKFFRFTLFRTNAKRIKKKIQNLNSNHF